MMRYLHALCILLLVGCGDDQGYIHVSVTAVDGIGPVDHIHVDVELAGQHSDVDFRAASGSLSLDTPQTLGLRFTPERRGNVTLTVDAISPAGRRLATGTTTAELVPERIAEVTVPLARTLVWKPQKSSAQYFLRDVWGPTRGTVYVTEGEKDSIFKTFDGGNTWTLHGAGVQDFPVGVHGSGGDTLVLVRDGTVVRERAGVWSQVMAGSGINVVDMHAIWANGSKIYVIGATNNIGGRIVSSSDSGATWAVQNSNTGYTLLDISGCGDDDVYIVAGGGTILHSSDGGANWVAQQSKVDVLLDGVSCMQKGKAIVVGAVGTIVRTFDDGKTWTQVSSGTTNNLRGVWSDGANIVYAVGDNGTIVYSSDGGSTWKSDQSNTPVALLSVWGSAPDDVYAVGGMGTILHLE